LVLRGRLAETQKVYQPNNQNGFSRSFLGRKVEARQYKNQEFLASHFIGFLMSPHDPLLSCRRGVSRYRGITR
jgi:hypothetical protein